MLRKKLVLSGAVAVAVACVVLIAPVRALAESALSVFRVADTKTITISITDLQDLMTLVKDHQAALDTADQAAKPSAESSGADAHAAMTEKAQEAVKPLDKARDFTAFPLNLPTTLKSETPKLFAIESQTKTVTLDTDKITQALTKLGATVSVPSSFNGTQITISTPPAAIAEYANVTLVATQGVATSAPEGVLNSLWSAVLSIPSIPSDLRAQLAAIDPQTRDIYLPVIEGLGRSVDLGGTTGYIYTASDFKQLLTTLQALSNDKLTAALESSNASVLLWTKSGVLYCLAGSVADSELGQIARSIHG